MAIAFAHRQRIHEGLRSNLVNRCSEQPNADWPSPECSNSQGQPIQLSTRDKWHFRVAGFLRLAVIFRSIHCDCLQCSQCPPRESLGQARLEHNQPGARVRPLSRNNWFRLKKSAIGAWVMVVRPVQIGSEPLPRESHRLGSRNSRAFPANRTDQI